MEKLWLLWENKDTGEISVIEANTPIEKVPFGFYCHRWTGTKQKMEIKKQQIIRKRICKPKQKQKPSLV